MPQHDPAPFQHRVFLLKLLQGKPNEPTNTICRPGKQFGEVEVLQAEIKFLKDERKVVEKE